ncbi:MAG: cytochrome c oxidase subunit II [Actinomycetota bacterium]|nr:cytochrome c oxidase subunit II [Actinomycetota bacterium]
MVLGAGCSTALAGCGSGSPSALDPAGFGADRVAGLWWFLLTLAVVVCAVVITWALVAIVRRRGPDVVPRPGGHRVVVVAGVVVPAVVLTGIYLLGLRDMTALQQPAGPTAATIDVIGHQWWWEVRYPERSVVTANEMHIPVGAVVHVRLQTADVNHSFWVPQLTPKTDLVAGRINDTWLKADRIGTFRGQCAEYCGLQHAHMAFLVVAQSAGDYARWLDGQAGPAPGTAQAASDPQVARGEQVFVSSSCASCHSVAGTSAQGRVGPDLTHLADRTTLAAGTTPNTAGYLSGWISNSQSIKPGNLMPPQPLSPDDLRAVVAFLEAGSGHPPPGSPASSSSSASAAPTTGGSP